jgi:NADH dehydrogenase (ubiquinone) 1 beta subcomplex subunit 3
MGGHGHEPYTIPCYKIYKVEDAPELVATRDALAARGLKDPWLRNEVWRFDRKMWGTEGSRAKALLLRGFRTGFAAFLVTIAGTAIYDKLYPSEHGHHEEH